MESPIIIIPDLHGRSFWRSAIRELPKNARVVFLGDYLDPYEDEWIYWTDAFEGLRDIIDFKDTHPEQVTLLLGNHDLHYLFPSLMGSRYNAYKAAVIRKTFEENMGHFQMAAEYVVGGKRFFITHAGLHSGWLQTHANLFGPADSITADVFNKMMFTEAFVEALSDVSVIRGGWCNEGSMVWADIEEYAWSRQDDDIIQIIGHSKQMDGKPKTIGNVICVDCLKAFVLDEDGLREMG